MTKPAAAGKTGVQAGSMLGQTMISPESNYALCGSRIIRIRPTATPEETG